MDNQFTRKNIYNFYKNSLSAIKETLLDIPLNEEWAQKLKEIQYAHVRVLNAITELNQLEVEYYEIEKMYHKNMYELIEEKRKECKP